MLANLLIDCDAVMALFAQEVLARAATIGHVELILDQSKLSERHHVLMLALHVGERAVPLAWRVEQTAGPIGLAHQRSLLDLVTNWLPNETEAVVLADRFYGTPELIAAGACPRAGAARPVRRAGLDSSALSVLRFRLPMKNLA